MANRRVGGRKLALAGALALTLAVVATVVYVLRFRTDTSVTELTDADALALLGDGAAPADGAPAVVPAPGIYLYATTGGDAIDALGGASHEYPDTTRIVVTATACGATQRWIAAAERYDEFVTCIADDGLAIEQVAFTEFHRFFNTDELEEYACSGEPRPVGAPVGTTWVVECTRADKEMRWEGEVLAVDTIAVDDADVAVDHVAWTITNLNDDRDEIRIETWYLAGTDLVVRRVGTSRTVTAAVVGDVRYTEDYELNLLAVTPLIADELTPASEPPPAFSTSPATRARRSGSWPTIGRGRR